MSVLAGFREDPLVLFPDIQAGTRRLQRFVDCLPSLIADGVVAPDRTASAFQEVPGAEGSSVHPTELMTMATALVISGIGMRYVGQSRWIRLLQVVERKGLLMAAIQARDARVEDDLMPFKGFLAAAVSLRQIVFGKGVICASEESWEESDYRGQIEASLTALHHERQNRSPEELHYSQMVLAVCRTVQVNQP